MKAGAVLHWRFAVFGVFCRGTDGERRIIAARNAAKIWSQCHV
jgi:hypothetical protein